MILAMMPSRCAATSTWSSTMMGPEATKSVCRGEFEAAGLCVCTDCVAVSAADTVAGDDSGELVHATLKQRESAIKQLSNLNMEITS
jgi:hypothetical protein